MTCVSDDLCADLCFRTIQKKYCFGLARHLNPGKKAITFRDLDKVDFGLTLQENAPLVELNKTVLLI